MSQSISRRSFLKCAGSGAVSLAAALLTGVPAAAQQPRLAGEPALLDGKAAVELLGYAPAQEMGNVLVYLSVENLSASTLPVGASYLQSREVCTLGDLYSMGTGVTAVCDGKPVRCGSFAAPLYGENAADASVFTLNLTAGRGALLHCFCAVPDNWQTLELTYHPDFAAGRSVTFTVNRSTDRAVLGVESHNLDLFFSTPATVRRLYAQNAAGHGAAVVEGAMGYYDGLGGTSATASAWHLADTLGLPVLLVDCGLTDEGRRAAALLSDMNTKLLTPQELAAYYTEEDTAEQGR